MQQLPWNTRPLCACDHPGTHPGRWEHTHTSVGDTRIHLDIHTYIYIYIYRRKWRVKYYKGLGTSTAEEGKEYFADLPRHVLDMEHSSSRDDDALVLAFSGDADRRKAWLLEHVAKSGDAEFVDHTASTLGYYDFVHKELVQFSYAHVQRSIPSVVDGLKLGQVCILLLT